MRVKWQLTYFSPAQSRVQFITAPVVSIVGLLKMTRALSRIEQAGRTRKELLVDTQMFAPGRSAGLGSVAGRRPPIACLTPMFSFLGHSCRSQGQRHAGVTQMWLFWLSSMCLALLVLCDPGPHGSIASVT